MLQTVELSISKSRRLWELSAWAMSWGPKNAGNSQLMDVDGTDKKYILPPAWTPASETCVEKGPGMPMSKLLQSM